MSELCLMCVFCRNECFPISHTFANVSNRTETQINLNKVPDPNKAHLIFVFKYRLVKTRNLDAGCKLKFILFLT
jgi:hypothetical protein